MPFTLIGIPIYILYFGLYQTIPIFICVVTSYTVVCGSGLFKALADRGKANAEKASLPQEDLDEKNVDPSLRQALVQQEKDFARSNYAQNKAKSARDPYN